MSTSHSLAIVLVLSVVTILIRSLPFLIFPEGKETPQIVVYLSKVLPCAVMGMLIIYCLKEVTPLEYPYGLRKLSRPQRRRRLLSLETEYAARYS